MDVLEVEGRLALLRMSEDVFIFFPNKRIFSVYFVGDRTYY